MALGVLSIVLASGIQVRRAFRPSIAWPLALAIALLATGGCQMVANQQNSDGVRMFEQAYYEGAAQRFQQAIQSDPNNPDGYYNLARTYHQLGKLHGQKTDLQQAESYYHQCLDHDANHQDCYRGLAVLLAEQGRGGDAFKLIEGWAARNPSAPGPKIELARLYDESGNRDAAKQQLIAAVDTDPTNARALAALGKLREDTGETAQALSNYQRSLAIDPYQPQLASRIAALSGPAFPGVTPPGATRVVTSPPPPVR
jgi:tetratricopeptide (TPR) repeat protein